MYILSKYIHKDCLLQVKILYVVVILDLKYAELCHQEQCHHYDVL